MPRKPQLRGTITTAAGIRPIEPRGIRGNVRISSLDNPAGRISRLGERPHLRTFAPSHLHTNSQVEQKAAKRRKGNTAGFDGYSKLSSGAFDTERAILPDEALTFIRETQTKTWEKLEALHGSETGERVLQALTKWLNTTPTAH